MRDGARPAPGRCLSDLFKVCVGMIDRLKDGVTPVARSVQNLVYVRQMLGELRGVAEAENADMLCYLIEMAMMEANDLVEASGGPPRVGRRV